MTTTDEGRKSGGLTIFLCFLAALLEGADIVSMGLAAKSVGKEFHFNPGQISYILTAAIVGLMLGAWVGGRAGDRVGRKKVVIVSFVVLAIFSILTAHAGDLNQFIIIRFLCGLGLGAAFPNLIAIAAEASQAKSRATGVGLMFAGQPFGGASFGLMVATLAGAGALDWRTIFYVGGIAPLLLLPVLIFALPESAAFKKAAAAVANAAEKVKHPSAAFALFGEGRTPVTVLLWISYGFTQVVVYLINNWLPTLMANKGFNPQQTGMISFYENLGAAAGCILLAWLADKGRLKSVLIVTYVAIAGSLWWLGAAQGFGPVVAAGVVIGFFAIGGQLVLYTMAPNYYPTLIRATGVGSAVSFGRLGGISGPLAAGALMSAGMAPAGVLLAAVPCAVLAGAAAIGLVFTRKPTELS
jgi:AAHS family 3-hydroxyphenylpropionic acid transporter